MKKLSDGHCHESPNNIRYFCPEHAPKPDSAFVSKPFEFFLGKFCKLAFNTGGDHDQPAKEHMWVQVDGVVELDGRTQLAGWLANEPVNAARWRLGDRIAFDREEVEDLTE
jgi:hypothetical protein